MDSPIGEKKATVDLEKIQEVLRNQPEDFKGAARILLDNGSTLYEVELFLESTFIISASIKNKKTNESIYGDKALQELQSIIKDSKGQAEIYSFSAEEFRNAVAKNDNALLELIKDAGKIIETKVQDQPENIPAQDVDSNPDDLEKDWQKLEGEWEEYDEKQKQYLDALDKQEINIQTQKILPVEEKTIKPNEDIERRLAEYESKTNARIQNTPTQAPAKSMTADEISDDMILAGENKEEKPKMQPEVLKKAQVPLTAPESPKKPPEIAAAPKQETKSEELLNKTTQEIDNLKKKVDVYWGYDKVKKRFVGMDHPPEPEAKQTPTPATLIEAAAPISFQADPQIYVLKKKCGLMDRMRLMKFPPSIKLIEKIDGKKTLEQIIKETKISSEDANKALETLKKEGYI